MTNAYDGHVATDYDLTLAVADYLYVGNGTKFNKITFDFGTVGTEDGVATAAYWNGSVWTSVTLTTDSTVVANNTFHQDGFMVFTIPNDWEANTVNGTETYWIRLDVATALTTVFSINEITVTRSNNVNINIGALVINTWTRQALAIVPEAYPLPDGTSIKSVGIKVAVNKAAFNLDIRDVRITVDPLGSARTTTKLPSSERVTGMEAYSGNVDDPILNPWIFTETNVYELQTQKNCLL
jgi:hypothetical protein